MEGRVEIKSWSRIPTRTAKLIKMIILLLDRRGNNIEIRSTKMITLKFFRRDTEALITKEILKVAAGNYICVSEIMMVIFD